jgi:putative PIN family toxin of toxin-antitoxin system
MSIRQRIVVDTNVLLSRLLLPSSAPARAVAMATKNTILVSEDTMNELADVLARPKFDPYLTLQERQQFLRQLGRLAEFVPIVSRVHECRDPKDDKFLELALNGRADLILTGDSDLLALNPWRGIAIVSAGAYVKL